MNNKFHWRRSIFGRLILTFVIIVIPVILTGVGIYFTSVHILRDQISKSMSSQAEYYKNTLEKEFQRIRTLQYNCLEDEDLNQLAVIPQSLNDIEKLQAILRLQRRLFNILNSSEYIKNVTAYITSINKSVSSTNGVYELTDEELELFKKKELYTTTKIVSLDQRLFIMATNATYQIQNSKEPAFIINIELDKPAIKSALNYFSKYKTGGAFIIDRATKFHISGRDDAIATSNVIKNMAFSSGLNLGTKNIYWDKYIILKSFSKYLDMDLFMYVSEAEVFKPLDIYKYLFAIFLLMAFFIILFFSVSTYRFIHKPLLKLVKAFENLEADDLSINIKHDYNDEFRYLFSSFNNMIKKINQYIEQIYMQQILRQKAELKQLQSQINPHFLYNSFFVLCSIAQAEGSETVVDFSKQLGNYFKFLTRISSEEVPLSEEVEHARIYAEIQETRFSNRISVNFDQLPESFMNIMVPRLIIQPIVENSFQHGLEKKTEKGMLNISFHRFKNRIAIVIEDNGGSITNSQMESITKILNDPNYTGEITGIINVNRRLQLKYGNKSGIRFQRSELGGAKVILTIEVN